MDLFYRKHHTCQRCIESSRKSRTRPASHQKLLFFPVPKLWISPVLPWLQVGSTDLLFQEKDHPAYTKSLLQILPAARVSSFGKASLLSPLPPEGSRFLRSSVPTSPVFPQSMQALPKSKTTPHIIHFHNVPSLILFFSFTFLFYHVFCHSQNKIENSPENIDNPP